ncbi:MAG: hypothetical protein HY235_29625 [Acidobacteria bacterium]|nr:hypothetical protein [Acidobacteriota bacterium]
MNRISWKSVVLGGLLAGLIINVSEAVLNMLVLADDMSAAMKALGKSGDITPMQIVFFNIWGFVAGITAVWLYAAIRPRYGAGPRTALCAGLAFWFAYAILGSIGLLVLDLFPVRPMVIAYTWGLAETLIATLAGAKVYKEEAAPAMMAASAH